MNPSARTARYTPAEELANSLTHGLGLTAAVAGLVWLCVYAALHGNAWHVVSASIYGASLVFLYTASTLYHGLRRPRAKALMRTLDHLAILFLIAGTYTPFTLVSLNGPWGWSLFGVVWGLAALGVVLEVTDLRYRRAASVALYLVMGWVVVIAARPLLAAVPDGGLLLLLLGGLAYTAGVLFYAWRSLPFHHAIWHLFVLAGSLLHYLAIVLYVMP